MKSIKNTLKTSVHYPLLCGALLFAGLGANLFAQESATSKDTPMGRIDAVHAMLTAEVTAIDLAKREVTLKGPQRDEVTITVSDAVKRLDEVKVGDSVRVDYLVSVAAEVRK
ncbi:MAG TPA: hypothetical protein VGF90_00670, partial [Verrucomicrobiae bacterium]